MENKILEVAPWVIYPIVKFENGKIIPLGTGFLISKDGVIVTPRHVIGNNHKNLGIIFSDVVARNGTIHNYQDLYKTTDINGVHIQLIEQDPFRDIAILKIINKSNYLSFLPNISSFDNYRVGEKVGILGFPHSVQGRIVLTYQETIIGAKVLTKTNGIETKHAIINTQARPGQSGSMIFSLRTQEIIGMLIGAYSPQNSNGINLGGINPHELHQTTHCVSAEYIKDMI